MFQYISFMLSYSLPILVHTGDIYSIQVSFFQTDDKSISAVGILVSLSLFSFSSEFFNTNMFF